MNRTSIQVLVLVAAAFVVALVSNAVAGRERKLVLPGYYPPHTPTGVAATPKPAPTPTPTTKPAPPPAPVTETVAPKPKPVVTSTQPRPKPTSPAPVDMAARFPPHPDNAYVEVSGADAALLHAHGALTLDARRTSVYEQGHIAGARPFSVWESDVDDKVNKLYEERSDPREQLKPILIYCSGGDCEDSHMLAQKLWGLQFNNLYVYKDGFPDWQKRGGAIRTGANP